MARIEGEIVTGRPVDVVFDHVADQSKEPSMGRTAEMLIECTGYDRPAVFASTTTMRPHATGMSTTTQRTPHCPSREAPQYRSGRSQS
jgi:hypothetical protein